MKLTRRSFIRMSTTTCIIGAIGDAHWIEPRFLRLTSHRVAVNTAPAGWNCRILHVADLHYDTDMPIEFLREAFTLGLLQDPDIVGITGDFIHWRFPETRQFGRFLGEISAAKPTFGTMGNHDGGAWIGPLGGYKSSEPVRKVAEDAGINILQNRSAVQVVRGVPVRIVGVGDSWANEVVPAEAFKNSGAGETVVLLSHNPDSKTLFKEYAWHVMLSGHTHGGQLRVPIEGGVPFAPVKDKRYVAGLNPWQDRWIHTSQGVATTGGLRFNCRPEVSIIELVGTSTGCTGERPGIA